MKKSRGTEERLVAKIRGRCEICEEPAEDSREKIGLTKVAPEDYSRIIDSNYQDGHSLTFTLIAE